MSKYKVEQSEYKIPASLARYRKFHLSLPQVGWIVSESSYTALNEMDGMSEFISDFCSIVLQLYVINMISFLCTFITDIS